MKIVTLTLDDNNEPHNSWVIENPSISSFQEGLKKLDGIRFFSLGLWVAEGVGMSISGGYNGVFLCQVITENSSFQLINPEASKEDEIEPIRDEGEIYPEYWGCSFSDVLKVGESYFETGKLCLDYSWEKE